MDDHHLIFVPYWAVGVGLGVDGISLRFRFDPLCHMVLGLLGCWCSGGLEWCGVCLSASALSACVLIHSREPAVPSTCPHGPLFPRNFTVLGYPHSSSSYLISFSSSYRYFSLIPLDSRSPSFIIFYPYFYSLEFTFISFDLQFSFISFTFKNFSYSIQ